MSFLSFLAGLLALVAAPGPTNAVMVASGALGGWRACCLAVCAASAGYLVTLTLAGYVFGATLMEWPGVIKTLRYVASAYLLLMAVRLWRSGGAGLSAPPHASIPLRTVFTISLLNPKALIIAFVLLPRGWPDHLHETAPYLVAVALVIPAVALGWAAVGWALNHGLAGGAANALVARLSAIGLGLFSIGLVFATLAG
jgi:threonine/homoserine/homoserine lactone efflux protein